MNTLTLLLEIQSQPTLILLIPPSKQWPWGKYLLQHYWLAKEYEEHQILQCQQHSPVPYLKALVPIQLP
jgi:hypothetical protein